MEQFHSRPFSLLFKRIKIQVLLLTPAFFILNPNGDAVSSLVASDLICYNMNSLDKLNFDVSRTVSDQVKYISLRKENSEIVPYTAEKYMDIQYNPIEFAGDKLFHAIVVKAGEDVIDGE